MDNLLITSTGINAITTTPCHVFVATTSGLDVFDPDSKVNIAYAIISGGCNDLYVDPHRCEDVQVYLGTTLSGVVGMVFTKDTRDDISASVSGMYYYPTIPSNNITCINVNEEDEIVVGSVSGVSFLPASGAPYSHSFSGSVTSCDISSSGDVYYSPTNSGLYVKYNPITTSWTTPDYIIDTTSTPSLSGNTINDMEVIYNSVSGNYEIFLGTNSGIAMYSEDRPTPSGSYMLLEGELGTTIINVTGIEVHAGSYMSSGSLTFATGNQDYEGIVGVYSLISGSVEEEYSQVIFESISGTIKTISGTQVLGRSY